jgi:hypothetical protein
VSGARLEVVSGGQTGVDRAALDAALALGLPCGGWCPRGRWAEDGAVPDRYPLWETLERERISRLNVAGPRESEQPGIHDQAAAFLREVFARPEEAAAGVRR